TLARLSAIPSLLRQAAGNVDFVPETFHRATIAMLNDCGTYLGETAQGLTTEDAGRLAPAIEAALSSLGAFGRTLGSLRPVPDRELAVPGLETTLRDRFGSVRNLSEVFEIAVEERSENLRELESLQKDLAPGKSWRELYHDYSPEEAGAIDTITLYQREME